MFLDRYLNFHCQHSLTHKRGIIYEMIDKILLLSYPKFHQKNIEETINILLNNSYPLQFIFSSIRSRINFMIKKDPSKIFKKKERGNTSKIADNTNKKDYFTVPHIYTISESFSPIAKKFNFNIFFNIPNTLKKYIKTGKDSLDTMSRQDVVYKINCFECEASYIG